MRRNVWQLAAIGVVVIALALVVRPFLRDSRPVPYHPFSCLSNLKQSSLALLMYASDENDRFPPRDHWMDASYPYTKSELVWHCPVLPKGVYGYAFNAALDRAKIPKVPEGTPLLYDSVDPVRNASDLCASLPLPGRHGNPKEGGANNVAYADGHAKSVPVRPVVH